jgi:rubrerythrin
MAESKVQDILKKAIVLEQQGQSFYRNVANQTGSDAVRNIFEIMAREEKKHEQALVDQYKRYEDSGKFHFEGIMGSPEDFASKVLSDDVRREIEVSGYEAASISAAIQMEKKTIDLYESREKETDDPEEKKLFAELARWEQSHANYLNDIYNDLLESVWYDQNFWPF